MSLQWTAAINEAKRILKDPLSRARYLATGNPKPIERGGPQPDGDFLETIFDLQMMTEADPDGARKTVQTMWDTHHGQLEQTFSSWEAGEASLDGVEMILAKLQYLNTARNHTGA
jgi:curved DNA-binding protein CbpA